jgi:hypothetical protein
VVRRERAGAVLLARSSCSRPHEHGATLVGRDLMDLDEFRLEGFKSLVRQVELHPQRPIGDPASAPQ